ncbi:hypothetical protein DMENIID0001_003910 [Sergentomyia squamirostris]
MYQEKDACFSGFGGSAPAWLWRTVEVDEQGHPPLSSQQLVSEVGSSASFYPQPSTRAEDPNTSTLPGGKSFAELGEAIFRRLDDVKNSLMARHHSALQRLRSENEEWRMHVMKNVRLEITSRHIQERRPVQPPPQGPLVDLGDFDTARSAMEYPGSYSKQSSDFVEDASVDEQMYSEWFGEGGMQMRLAQRQHWVPEVWEEGVADRLLSRILPRLESWLATAFGTKTKATGLHQEMANSFSKDESQPEMGILKQPESDSLMGILQPSFFPSKESLGVMNFRIPGTESAERRHGESVVCEVKAPLIKAEVVERRSGKIQDIRSPSVIGTKLKRGADELEKKEIEAPVIVKVKEETPVQMGKNEVRKELERVGERKKQKIVSVKRVKIEKGKRSDSDTLRGNEVKVSGKRQFHHRCRHRFKGSPGVEKRCEDHLSDESTLDEDDEKPFLVPSALFVDQARGTFELRIQLLKIEQETTWRLKFIFTSSRSWRQKESQKRRIWCTVLRGLAELD